MSYAGLILITLLCLTFYLLSALPLDATTICYIGLSVFISNIGILTTENQSNSSQMFILSRYSIINNVLLQLLFDCPEMKERNRVISDDMRSRKEFQYTKYRNNYSSTNVLLRDQLEISTIARSEKNWRKKEDLKNQKKKMEEFSKTSAIISAPKALFDKKSQVHVNILKASTAVAKALLSDISLSTPFPKNQLPMISSENWTSFLCCTINSPIVSTI